MKLNRPQRRLVRFLDLHRSKDPTFLRQVRFSWLTLFAIPACLGAWFFLSWLLLGPVPAGYGLFFLGAAFGALGREMNNFLYREKCWPVYREVINWRRVSELVESDPGGPEGGIPPGDGGVVEKVDDRADPARVGMINLEVAADG